MYSIWSNARKMLLNTILFMPICVPRVLLYYNKTCLFIFSINSMPYATVYRVPDHAEFLIKFGRAHKTVSTQSQLSGLGAQGVLKRFSNSVCENKGRKNAEHI